MSYSAIGEVGLNNVGNILYLSNNITTLSSNLTIGTSPVTNEQFYFVGNANITGNLISFSNVFIPNGNVGIGTRNPRYPLDVAGGANISSNTIMNANANVIGNLGVTGNLIGTSNIILLNGRMGIGMVNPQYTLDVAGATNISGNLYVGGATANENTRVIIKNDIVDTVTNGTTSGTSINMLGLNNNTRTWYFGSDGATTGNTQLYLGTSGGQANDPDYFCYWDTNGRMMVYAPVSGSITAPNSTDLFTVRGNANIVGNILFTGNLFQNGSPYIGSQWITSAANIYYNTGNVGIGTSSPKYTLDVAGSANISSNTIMNANANVLGNLGVTGNIIAQSNIILPSGSKMVIGSTSINNYYDLSIAGNLNVATSMRSGTMGQFGNITYHIASDGTPIYSTVGTGRNLILNHSTFNSLIGPNYPNPESMFLMTNTSSSNIFQWGMYTGIVKDLATSIPSNSLRMDFGSTSGLSTNLNDTGGNTITPQMTLRYTGNSGILGINRTNPMYALDVNGSANISVDTFIRNNLAVGTTTATANLTIVGNARVSANLFVGPDLPFNLQNGTALAVRNTSVIDSNINGSLSGNVYHQLAMSGRNWVFSQDVGNDGILYFGAQGGGDPDPDFEYYFKRSVGLQIQPNPSIITTDFTEALKVLGTANITGNVVHFANVLIPNGNIGIGTNNPRSKLDILGNANITGNINFTGNLYQNGNLFTGGGGSQWINGTGSGNIYYNGNVGINKSNPIYALDVAGDANIGANVYGNNFYIRNDCLLQSGDFSILNGNLTVYERFNAFGESYLSGNLTVYNSDIYNYGNIYTYNGLYINKNGALYNKNETTGQHAFYAYDTVNFMTTIFAGADDTNKVGYIGAGGYGTSLPLILNPLGGNVGIATGTPKAKLDIQGNAIINGNLNIQNGNLFMNRFGNLGLWTTSPMANLHVNGNAIITGNLNVKNGAFFILETTGNVGLGTATPNVQLQLSTDGARKLTTTTWLTGSDYRIKEDIVYANLDTCYQIVSNIPLHHYKWIPQIANIVEDKSMLGWIAQEVEIYFPKAVSQSAEYGLNDFRTLNADQMYKVMYGALQKVIQKVETQDLIIQNLQSEILTLKSNI